MTPTIAAVATAAAFGAALYRYFAVLFVAQVSADLEPETARGFFGGVAIALIALAWGQA